MCFGGGECGRRRELPGHPLGAHGQRVTKGCVPSTLRALGTVRSARPSQLPGGELDFWGGCGRLPGRPAGSCSCGSADTGAGARVHPRAPRSPEELGCRAHPLSAPSCARSPAASCSARAPAAGPSTSPASGCPGRPKGASSAASVSQASAVPAPNPGQCPGRGPATPPAPALHPEGLSLPRRLPQSSV